MKESFDINRYIALVRPLYLKKSLIGGAFLSLIMVVIFFIGKTNNLSPFICPIFGGANWIAFSAMMSRSDLSRFLLLPATGHEKFAALVTKAILYPTIELLIIVLLIRIITLLFPSMVVDIALDIQAIILYVLMFVVLFALRVQIHMNGFMAYILFMIIMIGTLISDKTIRSYFGEMDMFFFYRNLFYSAVILIALTISLFELKRIVITRIKK